MINFEDEEVRKEIEESCCRDPEHDNRQGPLKDRIEHAILSPYRHKGKEYLSVRAICRECARHRKDLNGVLSLSEAIRRRNQRRKLCELHDKKSRQKRLGQAKAC
ncbi:hypothetical protein KJ969_04615 [Patescibacteria group bacterium]|nr:hypothetical protein [Patescibacteria group bacterium]MBU1922521.1 hypothetical protein [Patescibacteria group bacterium]